MQKNNDKNLEKTVDNVDVVDEKTAFKKTNGTWTTHKLFEMTTIATKKTSTTSAKRKRVVFLPTTPRVKPGAKPLLRL